MTAKTRAIPSLHRDYFLAEVPGPWPLLASGNTTSLYCRAVSGNCANSLNVHLSHIIKPLGVIMFSISTTLYRDIEKYESDLITGLPRTNSPQGQPFVSLHTVCFRKIPDGATNL